MSSALRVPFGLQDGKLYEPFQVPNGKSCGCACPACKRPLVARQNAATPHFAHASGQDCAKALETAVHLAAKQLIAERRELRLPALKFYNHWSLKQGFETIYVERVVKLDEVHVEKWLDDMRPDLVVTINGQNYLVEIAVTHFVDEVKFEKIRQRKIPTIEIDAASLKTVFTFAALEDLLFTTTYPATWLYHPRAEELALEAQCQYQAEEDKKEAERPERQERFRMYREMPPKEKLARNLRNLSLNAQQLDRITTFVAWEKSFGVPRNIWQSAVLVFLAKEEKEHGWEDILGTDICIDDCLDWLRKTFTINPEVKDGDSIALWKFFRHLETLGILEHSYGIDFYLKMPSHKWGEIG